MWAANLKLSHLFLVPVKSKEIGTKYKVREFLPHNSKGIDYIPQYISKNNNQ